MSSLETLGLKTLLSITSGLGYKRKLIILIYHRVFDSPDFMYPKSNVNVETFDWQMQLLAKNFNVLSLSTALEKVKTETLPARAVCITFDDGYADNYLNALPILKYYELPATFFVVSGILNENRMWNDDIVEAVRLHEKSVLDLTELGLGIYDIDTTSKKSKTAEQLENHLKYLPFAERSEKCKAIANLTPNLPQNLMLTRVQLQSLNKQGMEIGAHSVSHPILKNLEPIDWKREMLDCKTQLERIIEKPVRYFAYPNGKLGVDFNQKHAEFAKECGYEAALSTNWGHVLNNSNLFQLPRFTPWDKTPTKFMLRMASMYQFNQ